MNTDYVDFSEFNAANLIISPFQQKQSKAEAGQKPITYYEMPLSYNFGSEECPIIREFLFQYPEMSTNSGMVEGQTGGRRNYSVPIMFSLTNVHHNEVIEVLRKIHQSCSDAIKPVRVKVSMPHFDPKLAEATGFTFPLYYPKDKETGEIINGKNPSCFLKMKYAEYGKRTDKALFTDMNGNGIDWKLMENVEMKFIPLVHIEKLYIGGGKIRLQMKCISAIVTNIVKKGSITRQMRTINKLKENDPDITSRLERQILSLKESVDISDSQLLQQSQNSQNNNESLSSFLNE
jgi:hypothetical protein